jgi:hypothetical protein
MSVPGGARITGPCEPLKRGLGRSRDDAGKVRSNVDADARGKWALHDYLHRGCALSTVRRSDCVANDARDDGRRVARPMVQVVFESRHEQKQQVRRHRPPRVLLDDPYTVDVEERMGSMIAWWRASD